LFRIFDVVLHAGLPMFIAAICLNMISSEAMCGLEIKPKKKVLRGPDGKPVMIRPNDNSSWRKVVVPILLIGTTVSYICAISLQIMKLTAWFMIPISYNVLQFGGSMGSDHYYLFAIMVILFLVIVPGIKLIAITLLWYGKVPLHKLDMWNQIVKAIGKWAMIDVFTCAFFIFINTSYLFIPGVVMTNNAYVLIVYSVLNYILDIVT